MSKDAIKMVMLRNEFYRDNFRRALLALLLMIVINVGLAGGIIYKLSHPPKPQYFATNGDGQIINWHPLTDPVVPDNFVLQWVSNATRRVFNLDYIHWRQQLQDASGAFTPAGWHDFLSALNKSNNLKTLVSLKMVSNATITGAPRVVRKEVVGKRFAWKIRLPILVTFTNKERSIPMPMIVTLVVVRMPVKSDPDRIAINNFLPVAQKSPQQVF